MMARATRASSERLQDILEAIRRIKSAELKLADAEKQDDDTTSAMAMDAVLYNLVIIGEAVNALPSTFVEKESQVPWRDIVAMRNFLSHEYFRVLVDVVRQTLDAPLEELRGRADWFLPRPQEPSCTSVFGTQGDENTGRSQSACPLRLACGRLLELPTSAQLPDRIG